MPVEDGNIEGYEEMLDFVMDNDDLQNIAITGSLGSGKSSFIETYKSKNKRFNFLHISLANFQSHPKNEIKCDCESKSVKNQLDIDTIIEGKILNQLLHKIPSQNIPLSKFKNKDNITKKRILLRSLLIVALIISSLGIAFFRDIASLLYFATDIFKTRILLLVLKLSFVALFLITISTLVYIITEKLYLTQFVGKINFQGNNIEILEDNENSYFDKYLNEVLYLFENCGSEIVVFEDLDRYDVNHIFVKLREINNLINNKIEKKNRLNNYKEKKEKIKFFYLLRDDVFTSKDRTKFFDFIIPILPYLDAYNSKNILIEKLTELQLYTPNELAMMEQNEKYDVYRFFSVTFLRDISFYITEMRLLNNIINEYIIYFTKLKNLEPKREKLLSMLIYKNLFPKDFNDLQIGKGYIFDIFSRHNKGEFNSKKLEGLKSKPLSSAIDSENLDIVFEEKYREDEKYLDILEDENFPLIKYLLRNGYIDERTYIDYFSEFRAGSLTYSDNRFVRSFSYDEKLPFNYNIDMMMHVLHSLEPSDFQSKRILNYDILNFIIKDKSGNYENELHLILQTITSNNELNFVNKYILENMEDNLEQVIIFVQKLNEKWVTIWEDISNLEENNFDKRMYAVLSLHHLDDLEAVDEGRYLTSYIENSKDFLAQKEFIHEISMGLNKLNIKFNEIAEKNNNEELMKYVYKNEHYKINMTNICMFISFYYNVPVEKAKIFSIIHDNSDTPLYKYVTGNIDDFLKEYIEQAKFEDNNEAALYLAENATWPTRANDSSSILKYFENWQGKLLDTTSLDMKTLNHLFKLGKVDVNSENILHYYNLNNTKFNKNLTSFLNEENVGVRFEEEKIIDKYDENFYKNFVLNLIQLKGLKNVVYKEIFKMSNLKCNRLSTTYNEKLSDENINILIKNNVLVPNQGNISVLRKDYPKYLIDFIIKNIDECLSESVSIDLQRKEKEALLKDSRVDDIYKIRILNQINDPISIKDANFTEKVIKHILENNYNPYDFELLIIEYPNFKSSYIKEFIENQAIKNAENIKTRIVPKELREYLYLSERMSDHEKLELFSNNIPKRLKDTTRDLSRINSEITSKLYKLLTREGQTNIPFPKEKTIKTILTDFKNRRWINSINECPDGKYYRANWKKHKGNIQ